MQVTLGLMADYANVTADGKLNIMGVFDGIFAASFPVVLPQMQLVLRFEADPTELGATRALEICLRDEDGRQLFSISAEMQTAVPPGSPVVGPLRQNQVINFQGIRFDKPGSYDVLVLVNGDVKRTIPFKVVARPVAPAARG